MNYKYNRYNRLLKGRITSKEESRIIRIQQLVQQGSLLNLPSWFVKDEVNNALIIGDSYTVGLSAVNQETEGYIYLLKTALENKFGKAGSGLNIPMKPPFTTTDYTSNFNKFTATPAAGTILQDSGPYGMIGISLKVFNDVNTYVETSVVGKYFDVVYSNATNHQKIDVYLDGIFKKRITLLAPGTYAIERITADVNGAHTLKFQLYALGASVEILDVIQYSGDPGINVNMVGKSGAATIAYKPVAGPLSLTHQINIIQPKLFVINLGYNEFLSQIARATYEANLTEFVNAALPYGKVFLANLMEAGIDRAIPITSYNESIQTVATATGAKVIDIFSEMGSFQNIKDNSLGVGTTFMHPSTTGHAKIANKMYADLIK